MVALVIREVAYRTRPCGGVGTGGQRAARRAARRRARAGGARVAPDARTGSRSRRAARTPAAGSAPRSRAAPHSTCASARTCIPNSDLESLTISHIRSSNPRGAIAVQCQYSMPPRAMHTRCIRKWAAGTLQSGMSARFWMRSEWERTWSTCSRSRARVPSAGRRCSLPLLVSAATAAKTEIGWSHRRKRLMDYRKYEMPAPDAFELMCHKSRKRKPSKQPKRTWKWNACVKSLRQEHEYEFAITRTHTCTNILVQYVLNVGKQQNHAELRSKLKYILSAKVAQVCECECAAHARLRRGALATCRSSASCSDARRSRSTGSAGWSVALSW